jgi:hypothetical protein
MQVQQSLTTFHVMKAKRSFQLIALAGLVLTGASCQHAQEQQAKPKLQVERITSPTIHIQHDTALFNKVMSAPTPPDSIP